MTDDNQEETMDVTLDNYNKMMNALSQVNAEGWIPVRRRDTEPVEARPVDRQADRAEGSRIESDRWLIREADGESYTVSAETFDEKYDTEGSLRTEQFVLDLSWETTTENPDGNVDEEVEIGGWDCVATVDALIYVPTQMVVSLDVVSVDMKQDNYRDMDGIPLELLYDSPRFNTQ